MGNSGDRLKSGQKVRDFILENKIGEGGVGEVWRARHQLLDKVYAIKVIFPHLSSKEDFQERFLLEAVAMASLDHPNIVGVHNFFSEEERTYLVMSFVEGQALDEMIEEKGSMSFQDAVGISDGILDALNFAHNNGVIHRDVKPSNIIIRPDGKACLVDFGIALVMGKPRVTQYGVNIGTPEYMSPEQIKAKELDHRTDVYSFGCVLYEMLNGNPPFGVQSENLTDFDIMSSHISTPPPPLDAANVNSHVEAVVNRALEKDPNKRFSGCKEMALALAPPPSAPETEHRPDLVTRIKRLEKTRKLLVMMSLFFFLSTVAAAGGWVMRMNGAATGSTELKKQITRQAVELDQLADEKKNLAVQLEQAVNEKENLAAELVRRGHELEADRHNQESQIRSLHSEQFKNAVFLYALIKSNSKLINYARLHIRKKESDLQQVADASKQQEGGREIRVAKKRLTVLVRNNEAKFQHYVATVKDLAGRTSEEIERASRSVSEGLDKKDKGVQNGVPNLKNHIREARPAISAGQALEEKLLSSWRRQIHS